MVEISLAGSSSRQWSYSLPCNCRVVNRHRRSGGLSHLLYWASESSFWWWSLGPPAAGHGNSCVLGYAVIRMLLLPCIPNQYGALTTCAERSTRFGGGRWSPDDLQAGTLMRERREQRASDASGRV